MSNEMIITVLGLTALFINFTTMFITFDTKRGLLFSAGILAAFTVVYIIVVFYTKMLSEGYSGLRGLIFLPIIILLFKGAFFQKIFAFFLQYFLTVFQSTFASSIILLFIPKQNGNYYMILLVTVLAMNTGYVYLMFKFGRNLFQKMFINGQRGEWMLYAAGSFFSFVVLTALRIIPIDRRLHLLLLSFSGYSFAVLCFTLINAHEKSKQQYETEFARDVISSGRDHFQKMDDLYEKLRILRHDYKYHLSAAREMLDTGDADGADKYLTEVEGQLTAYELKNHCENPVINALVARYEERCKKLNINFTVNLVTLKTLNVPNYELCIIIGNLLENAVEACEKMESSRHIKIIAEETSAQFMLMVENSFNGVIRYDMDKPISTKANGGVGLRSVKTVACRYGGDLYTEWNEHTFTAYVTLQL